MKRSAGIAFVLLLALISRVGAQQVRGTVTDSASRRPIPGAVLSLYGANNAVLGRNITNERGEFVLAGLGGAQRVRVQRIGFRPRDFPLPTAGGDVTLNVALVSLPTFLEPVRVTANGCPRRSDQGSAIALLDQARAALLNTIVARETKPATMVLYTYDRTMNGTSERIDRQVVRADSSYRVAVSFSAVFGASDFVERGFMRGAADGLTFYAPDADVLLSDAFATGYCFRLMAPNRARPNQLGLGFSAADRKRDRIDVDGALWIDTAARSLRDIEFKFAGLDPNLEQHGPGGTLSFREMSNGTVLIDQWTLRLVGVFHDTVPDITSRDRRGTIRNNFYVQESGGELAHAVWRDGTSWHARLGVLDARLIGRNGKPATERSATLPETPYRANPDSMGRIVLRGLVPGAYSLVLIDTALARVNLTIPTELRFGTQRDSLAITVKVPNLDEFVIDRCLADRTFRYALGDSTRVLARVLDAAGKPIDGVSWRIYQQPSNPASNWVLLREGGRTGTDGIIHFCDARMRRGAQLRIEAWKSGTGEARLEFPLKSRVNVVPIALKHQ
jgi:hypothetical protein